MNVLPIQNSLFRQLDAVALVAPLHQAANVAQHTAALDAQAEALHQQDLVAEAEQSHSGLGVGRDGQEEGEEQRAARRRAIAEEDKGGTKPAPARSPLGAVGHNLDIIA